MARLLFGVQPFDAVSFLLMTGLVLAIVTLASLIPSIRAMRETILTTLRES
jgi:ABC-type lipoprotein release transport system permease subunit